MKKRSSFKIFMFDFVKLIFVVLLAGAVFAGCSGDDDDGKSSLPESEHWQTSDENPANSKIFYLDIEIDDDGNFSGITNLYSCTNVPVGGGYGFNDGSFYRPPVTSLPVCNLSNDPDDTDGEFDFNHNTGKIKMYGDTHYSTFVITHKTSDEITIEVEDGYKCTLNLIKST